MFPISSQSGGITNKVTVSDFTGSYNLLVPGRVVASSYIIRGTHSMSIDASNIVGQTDVVQMSVRVNSLGTLELDKNSKTGWNENIHWARALRLANDCHNYNIQIRRLGNLGKLEDNKNEKLILEAVRPIEAGKELLLWFSEDVLATLHMSFLAPANIQGQKKYICTRCSALYEFPNPLKLHLTLGCGKHTMQYMWEKLADSLKVNRRTKLKHEFNFQLTPEPIIIPKEKGAINISTAIEKKIENDKILHRPYTNNDVNMYNLSIIPFHEIDNMLDNNSTENKPILQKHSHWPMFTMPPDYIHTPILLTHSNDDETQIKTMISNLGMLKHGHICLYCGKTYSRKYGLKIHIRTHTGYKPLKCKYCMRPFGDPSNLNKHVRLHDEGDTPYKCELCGKVSVRRRDLERHLKSRHMIDISLLL